MSIKDKYTVRSIDPKLTHEWLLYKHYAKRIPPIEFSFGIYLDKKMIGVCTFGPPARYLNDGYGIFGGNIKIKTYELNRLVINENSEKNVLSYFVSNCLKLMPKPSCIVSYADSNHYHHGYIYQATNWIFTGSGGMNYAFKDKNGKDIHKRTLNSMFGNVGKKNIPENYEIYETEGKYRYIKFIGNKTDRKKMMKNLTYKILPYPKGDNKRYDASHKCINQGILF